MALQCKDVSVSPFQMGIIQRDPMAFMHQITQQHGDFVYFPIKIAHVFLFNHPDLIERVLVSNQRNYSKDTVQFNLLSLVTGQGLLTSNGRFWLRQRRLSQPAFHHNHIETLGNMIVDTTRHMLPHLDTAAQSGTPIDIDETMMALALEIVGKALFGLDLHEKSTSLTQATLTILDFIVDRAQRPFPLPLAIPTPRHRRFRRAQQQLDAIVDAAIEARSGTECHQDILGMLMAARDRDTGAAMTRQELRDEMMTFLIAGHETSASGLTWFFYLLSQHPEVEARLLAELNGVLNGRFPSIADLARLPYLKQVMQEVHRCYPPSWLVTRRALAADEIGGHPIPARSLIIMSPYAMHHNPTFWPEPDQFNPERFAPQEEKRRPRLAYIPFGSGPRKCIGDYFAQIETMLIVATILPKYQLRLKPNHPVEAIAQVTIRPRYGMPMAVERR